MRLFNSTSFAALLLAGSMVACTVGDTAVGRPSGDSPDGGQSVVNADAAVVTELRWTPTTMDQVGLKPAMHYVSPTEIYAVVGEKICMWNGTAWVDHTLPEIGLAPAMQFISPTQIYAVVGNKVSMWNGTEWLVMTPNIAGINDNLGSASIQVVPGIETDEIYAAIIGVNGGRIAKSVGGGAWVDMTEPMLGMRYEMSVMPGGIYYAMVGNEIHKATAVLDALAPWAPLAPEQLGLRTAMQVVSDTEIYAVIDTKVCKFDGLAWADVTTETPDLRTAFMHTSDEDIMAIAGSAVTHWAPVTP
jgi:hypothetical protein